MTTVNRTTPVDIKIDRGQGYMLIVWKEGDHKSLYPLAYLRRNCPCAACLPGTQEEQKNINYIPLLPSSMLVGQEQLEDATLIGRYALRLVWGDGHDAGIYPFEFLRNLCPCDECTNKN